MKKRYKILKLAFCLLLISANLVVFAQSNLTEKFGATMISTHQGDIVHSFKNVKEGVKSVNGDYLLLTANFEDNNFPATGKQRVLDFRFGNETIIQIGVENRDHWYIRRKASLSQATNKSWLDYEIYDDLGVSGTFTFIIGHHFIGIAKDEFRIFQFYTWKFAPVFFGMDSNIGKYSSHAGQFTGETSVKNSGKVYVYKDTKSWKLGKISDLIKSLNTSNTSVTNAKTVNNKEEDILSLEEPETALLTDFKIYPNPTDGDFEINFGLKESSSVSFEILNLNGQVIFRENEQIYNGGNNKYIYNNQKKLPTGMYILNITSNSFKKSLKFVIK